MFWNKGTPIDHKEDVCCLCGKNVVTRCKFTGVRLWHTRDDCLQHLRLTANAAYRRVLELEKKVDSLAGDISKLYSREPSAVLIGHYDIPKTTKPRPKARPKKDTST